MFFLRTPEEGVQTITNHEEAASTATIVSTAANLALLAKKGKRVTLADLDIGGADIHILFGLMNPPLTLADFLNRRVERLEDIAQALPVHSSLPLIPGTGDTLATANMSYAKKKRLIPHLKNLQTEIVIVNIGAGTSYHALDFFLMADDALLDRDLLRCGRSACSGGSNRRSEPDHCRNRSSDIPSDAHPEPAFRTRPCICRRAQKNF
jgi:hypothetical protein